MKWKVMVSLLAFASLFSVAAQAQEERQKFEVFAGYSYVRANPSTNGVNSFSLNGGSASVSYKVNNWLSGVADFGGYTNSNILKTGTDGTLSTYLFGPRVTLHRFAFGRVTPFADVLFGVAHTGSNVVTTTGNRSVFGMTVGGGVDYRLNSHWSLRPAKIDYLLTRFNELNNGSTTTFSTQTQNNLRVSTGIVFRF